MNKFGFIAAVCASVLLLYRKFERQADPLASLIDAYLKAYTLTSSPIVRAWNGVRLENRPAAASSAAGAAQPESGAVRSVRDRR